MKLSDPEEPAPITGVHRMPLYGAIPQYVQPQHSGAIQINQAPDSTVSVERIHIPLPAMIAVLVFMLGGVVSMTLVWAQATNSALHVEPALVTAGGGVAYKNDVSGARQDMKDAILKAHKSTRNMLLGMKLGCKRTPSSADLDCKVTYLPEPE